MVISCKAVIVGSDAGLKVIILDTEVIVRPHGSAAAVQVSKTVPPQAPGVVVKVEGFDVPAIKQSPLSPLLKGSVLGTRAVPQATVIAPGAVIVGAAGGFTVISCEAEDVFPQRSVAVQVLVMA